MSQREQDKEFVREVINKMNTQDNRGTAMPYFYQIRDYEKVTAPDDDYEGYLWIHDVEETGLDDESTWDEKFEYLQEHMDDDFHVTEDMELDPLLEELECTKWYYQEIEVFKGLFFTEEAAKIHLKLNYYHYSHKADTYVSHAWKSPEVKQFFEAVARLVDMEYKIK